MLGLAAAVMLQAAGVAPDEIKRPVWDRKPTGMAASRNYPQALANAGGGARARAACVAASDGGLTDCRVIEESRPGLGAGEALLKILALYRLRATDGEGRPVAGRPLNIAMTFQAPIVFARAENGWEVLQQPWAWDDAYPEAALKAGVSGEVVVECKGKKGARKVLCEVVSETPSDQGFGAAGLELQKRILVKPPAGAPTTLRMMLSFRAPPSEQALR